MRAVFIRHGESTANVGLSCTDVSLVELTPNGWKQATRLAQDWMEAPTLIVISPFLRTQQTASPTMERFPAVPVEVWPIQEFTYLQPGKWNGTARSVRLPHIERFWTSGNPDYCDGEGAESFADLLSRAAVALRKLDAMPEDALVYIFSHGHFMQAVRSLVVLTCPPKTAHFRVRNSRLRRRSGVCRGASIAKHRSSRR